MKTIFYIHNFTFKFLFLALLLSALTFLSSNSLANHISNNKSESAENDLNKPLIIGIFPRRNKSVTRKIYAPMVNYLSKHLHRKVILKTPRTFSIFWENIEDEKYDFVHYNQYHYIISNKKHNYHVILRSKEFNSDTVAGAIVVRKDSNIKTIQDLRGKEIVFGGGPKAMQSYIYARYLLEQENLHLGEYIEEYSLNPPNALFSLYYGKSDAAGVGNVTIKLNMVESQIDTSQLKILVEGKQLPHLPWAVHSSLPIKTQELIKNTLSSLHKTNEGRSILKSAKLNQFIITKDSDYDEHRKIIKTVLDETY